MDVVVRQGERVKAVDSCYEEEKNWKTREKSRRKEIAVFGACCVYFFKHTSVKSFCKNPTSVKSFEC